MDEDPMPEMTPLQVRVAVLSSVVLVVVIVVMLFVCFSKLGC